MKVIIEDTETGYYISYNVCYTKLEPEDADYEEVRMRMDDLIHYIKKAVMDTIPEKEEEVKK